MISIHSGPYIYLIYKARVTPLFYTLLCIYIYIYIYIHKESISDNMFRELDGSRSERRLRTQMSFVCTRPFKAFVIGIEPNGKTKYKLTNYECDHLERNKNGEWLQVGVPTTQFANAEIKRDFMELPCGQCPSCRLRRAREWRDRCVAESMLHEKNYFITLTYDDSCLPFGPSGVASLRKKDLQLFWKRLRKDGYKFRYFACGEYGSTTFRPHYHACVFGLDLNDLKLIDNHWQSETVSSAWRCGFVQINEFTPATAGYTARYTYKKIRDLQNINAYEMLEVEPEFLVMSRKPGLGYEFFMENLGYFISQGYYAYGTELQGERMYSSRYLMKKLDEMDSYLHNIVKKRFSDSSEMEKDMMLRGNPRPYMDILNDQEAALRAKTDIFMERSAI